LSAHKTFRLVKQETRVLGVDDGQFTPHTKGDALIVGVVFRGGIFIEGVMHTHVDIDGLDATEKLVALINGSEHKQQLRIIMLNGVTFAGFNLVDIAKLNQATDLPVIALTQDKPDLDAIHEALKNLPDTELRWQIIQNAGAIRAVQNKGAKLYVCLAGISMDDALTVLDTTSTRGSLPEPLRVAHLIASGTTP
jgi:endonuclease V-like protein UPF0215 family